MAKTEQTQETQETQNNTENTTESLTIEQMQAQLVAMQQTINQLQNKLALNNSDFLKSKSQITITTFLEKDKQPKILIV